MKLEILPDAEAVAKAAAIMIAAEARASISARGRFVLAVSGGRTPWVMLRHLAAEALPWKAVQIVQVDERVAPAGDAERNLTHLQASLGGCGHVHAMPVEAADLAAAAGQYERTLQSLTGSPPVIDLVHLGLGADGHTASLVPEDAALGVTDRDVAVTGVYQGRIRMTLTYPCLNRARRILWVVTGSEKVDSLARLLTQDATIPAARVEQARATVLADAAAAG